MGVMIYRGLAIMQSFGVEGIYRRRRNCRRIGAIFDDAAYAGFESVGDADSGQFADDKVFRLRLALSGAANGRKCHALPTHCG